MQRVDLKKRFRHLYNPSSQKISVVDVSEMNFLTVDGEGDPNITKDYSDAVEALYGVSYALKFMLKKGPRKIDYPVMPLEGLWWADDMSKFSAENKAGWKWTAMIMQPGFITKEMVEEAKGRVEEKKGPLPGIPKMRFDSFHEGRSAQILYLGPYSEEGPAIRKLHEFVAEQGHNLRGKHHEIYLGDPRRAKPERLKTVIRQPFE